MALLYRGATEVVAVSDDNLRLLREHFGLPSDRERVILNGRPEAFFAPMDASRRQRVRQALGTPDDAVLVLSIGRMEFVKGTDQIMGFPLYTFRCRRSG